MTRCVQQREGIGSGRGARDCTTLHYIAQNIEFLLRYAAHYIHNEYYDTLHVAHVKGKSARPKAI